MSKELEELNELKELEEESKNIVDEASLDESVTIERYDISSYGADYDVEGMVKRLQRDDVYIPHFQRDYVWNINDASRFVESLLLGLPVPGVFLARDPDTNRLLVIDGQQRLKTLQFFYEGHFNPKPDQKTKRIFRLSNVQPHLVGLTYETLNEKDRIKLSDSIIHATIIKQESPNDEDTSVYHVFERLNTGGRKLTPQEIRAAIYHGSLIEMLRELNETESWRAIFGRKSNRLKDQELILRFLAMYYEVGSYAKPMSEFINRFAKKHRNPQEEFLASCRSVFTKTITVIYEAIGESAFRPERSLNAAVFDSVMVALARRLEKTPVNDRAQVAKAYASLLDDTNYKEFVSVSTSDVSNVQKRLETAIAKFSEI